MSGSNILKDKSYSFAIRIVKLNKYLIQNKKEFILSKQILKSGTAIGALVREAEFGQSRADFINKLSISLKEANETHYWIEILKDGNYINQISFDSLEKDCKEIIKILISSIKTLKENNPKTKNY